MKTLKKIFAVLISCMIICFSAVNTFASTSDEVYISSQDDKYKPLYTTSPDSSLKDHSSNSWSSKDYELFYTQTTFLALVAGYLILFKVKGLKSDEKLHRRR